MKKLREFFTRLSEKLPGLHSIRSRGMLVSTALVLTAVIAAVAVFAVTLHTGYYVSMRAALEKRAEAAADYFAAYVGRTGEDYTSSAELYVRDFADKDTLELQFVDGSGQVLVSSTGISGSTEIADGDVAEALRSGEISCYRGVRKSTGEKIMAVSAPMRYSDGSVAGIMRYMTSLKPLKQMVLRRCLLALLVGLAIMAVMTVSNLFFLGTITQPIRSLTGMARRIAGGSYGIQVEKRYDDEIGELTDTINDMSQKLAQTEKLQTEFISSVSHELRTPLTAITGWSETMAYDEAIQGDSRRGLEIITREAGRLTKMVEDLLEFTRIQDGRFTLQIETINLPALVEDTLYTYSELFRQEGIEVAYEPPEEDYPDIPGDAARLSQVLLNILDNACKYGRSGKHIEVALKMTDSAQAVSVRDHGPGIPPEELPHVKTKFYKGSSRERGNGIGLAVCEEIVSRHNGRLTIYNAEGGGLLVTVTLPTQS